MHTKTTAKDFFLYMGILVTLYSGIGFLLNLLFGIVNSAFPPIDRYWYNPSISFPVAALIVLTPVFLWLSYLVTKDSNLDPEKKYIWVRRWFIFLTLFGTGALVIGDLITLLYYFIDGRELTTGFLLKVLSVLVVAGVVFGYYLSELRNKVAHRKIWRFGTIFGVLAVIVLAFLVIGSPRTQQLLRYDSQKVADLQNIQSQVVSYWQQKSALPENLDALRDPLSSYYNIPLDPQLKEGYVYTKTGEMTFELCAEFNKESLSEDSPSRVSSAYRFGMENENWTHEAGLVCFERIVDPDRYPPFTKAF
jgi:hypothetical protein